MFLVIKNVEIEFLNLKGKNTLNDDILKGIVIPFYKKYFPNMYDESLNIVVELYDNVPKDKQKISSSKKDTTSTIATSLEVLRYNDYDELLDKLSKIVESRKVDSFVLGNPLNLDGSISKRSEITFEFKKLLEKLMKGE